MYCSCVSALHGRTKEVVWKPMADPLRLATHAAAGPDNADMQVPMAALKLTCICLASSHAACVKRWQPSASAAAVRCLGSVPCRGPAQARVRVRCTHTHP